MTEVPVDWDSLATIHPELKAIVDVSPPEPHIADLNLPMAVMREEHDKHFIPVPGVNVVLSWDGVHKTVIKIPVSDGAEIDAWLYQPESAPTGGSPLVVLYHGGGWCAGGPEMEEPLCVKAVQNFGAVALSVDYRLAPENPFPTGVTDCCDALAWISKNATTLKATPSRGFIIGGESTGATGSLVSALRARSEQNLLTHPITGMWLAVPSVLTEEVVPEKYQAEYRSMEQCADAPGVDRRAMKYLQDKLNPDVHDGRFNPFLWKDGHKGLPKCYFQICGLDPQRDEDLLFERHLREEYGIETKVDIYPGLSHAFWGFYPQMEVSRKAVGDTVKGLAWLLSRENLR
ncbi:putative lipase 2 protein [Neofusicoccum parvum]|uniref:Lipase 2 protein n=1 Tax=Neofusicoccum parvum TaxID=310453 RepID=A0ACB5SI32_9PEZI|nr:putative lipase 2 protein [Neofusicoccum parvum]